MTSRVSTICMSVLGLSLGAAVIGCGPSPAYEPEPRVPGSYAAELPGPLTDEERAAQNVPRPPSQDVAAGEVALGENSDEYADTDPTALTAFKPALDGHGTWVDDSTYGTVWVPSTAEVGTDFEPYSTAGHWTYDDDQSWVWASDYEWGWAPFHYGRWARLPSRGWSWIPGRQYSGAWVTWRTGGYGYDYVGWAPAAPGWYWNGGYAYGWGFGAYESPYWYCHRDYLYEPGWRGHAVYGGTPQGGVIAGHTQPYRPASPNVGAPSRVAANPQVGGQGGRTVASPRVNGPRPGDLGIKQGSVVAPPSGDTRLARARAMATPVTARSLGAAGPTTRARPVDPGMVGTGGHGFGGNERVSPSVASRLEPAARAPSVSNGSSNGVSNVGRAPNAFSGRIGAASPSPNANANAYQGVGSMGAPRPPSSVGGGSLPSRAPTVASTPSFRPPSVSSAPARSNAPTFHTQPTVHSAPSAPTFHAAPSVHSAPSVQSTPSVSHSAPTRSSGPSVRSSGGRSGGHR